MTEDPFDKYLRELDEEFTLETIGLDSIDTYLETQEQLLIAQALHDDHARVWGGHVVVTEKQRRNHVHVMGTSQSGKSKFFELNIRQDIDDGHGLLLIDPKGPLYWDVLRYCCKNDIRKVCFIDPSAPTIHPALLNPELRREGLRVYTSFNPLFIEEPERESVEARARLVAEALSAAFGDKWGQTPRLSKYLTAILEILIHADMTLSEIQHFFRKDSRVCDQLFRRFSEEAPFLPAYKLLTDLFQQSQYQRTTQLESTESRSSEFLNPAMLKILGQGSNSIPFTQMIRDNWVILFNLSARAWAGSTKPTVILGTLLLNVLKQSVPDDHEGNFYVYIDEVGEFATPTFVSLLSTQLYAGLIFHLAHQTFQQLSDVPGLDNAVSTNTRCKVFFDIPDPADRRRIKDTLRLPVSFDEIKNQRAWFKLPQEEPILATVPFVDPVDNVPKQALDDYLFSLYVEHDFYSTTPEVRRLFQQRYKDLADPAAADYRAAAEDLTQAVAEPPSPTYETGVSTRDSQQDTDAIAAELDELRALPARRRAWPIVEWVLRNLGPLRVRDVAYTLYANPDDLGYWDINTFGNDRSQPAQSAANMLTRHKDDIVSKKLAVRHSFTGPSQAVTFYYARANDIREEAHANHEAYLNLLFLIYFLKCPHLHVVSWRNPGLANPIRFQADNGDWVRRSPDRIARLRNDKGQETTVYFELEFAGNKSRDNLKKPFTAYRAFAKRKLLEDPHEFLWITTDEIQRARLRRLAHDFRVDPDTHRFALLPELLVNPATATYGSPSPDATD